MTQVLIACDGQLETQICCWERGCPSRRSVRAFGWVHTPGTELALLLVPPFPVHTLRRISRASMTASLKPQIRCACPQGDVYSYLRQSRGRLSEDVAVSLIMEPFLSGLAVIHAQV